MRRAAYRLAPRKILAYNSRLERHHLRLDLASFLFWRGVPLDRIYLRPWWWPWPKRERSVTPHGYRVLEGRACSPERRRVAVLSPYFPYPLSHGGAVRIYHLLREIAREFDVELFAFTDGEEEPRDRAGAGILRARGAGAQAALPRAALVQPGASRSARISIAGHARRPSPKSAAPSVSNCCKWNTRTWPPYGGDILVEHDVTFDLFGQIARRERTLAAWWDFFRWRRYETRAVRRYRRVVVMSPKDAALLGPAFRPPSSKTASTWSASRPQPEQPGQRLLFIGSFRHFPNVSAYRFFTERVWPLLRDNSRR